MAFAVGYRCDFRCAHCCVSAGPDEGPAQLDLATVVAEIDALAPELVVFTGGEPTLYADVLTAGIRHAHRQGARTRVVTNGGWAVTPAAAADVMRHYREAGLDELALSYSRHHEAFGGLDLVVAAAAAARRGSVACAVLVADDDIDGPVVREVRAALRAVSLDQVDVDVAPFEVTAAGRGSKLAITRRRPRLGEVDTGGCGRVLNPPVVTPDGEVKACCGFPYRQTDRLTIGHVRDGGVAVAVERARRDLVLRWLHDCGPWQVLTTIAPERYAADTVVAGAHICQGCTDLFADPELVDRLEAYVDNHPGEVLAACAAAHEVDSRVAVGAALAR